MNSNTNHIQDDQIRAAQSENYIGNLIAIIDELDAKISEWKDAAQCDEPDDLRSKLAMLST